MKESFESSLNKKEVIDPSIEDKQKATKILMDLIHNPKIRKIVFGTVLTLGLLNPIESGAQNVSQDKKGSEIENIKGFEKDFESNYIIKPDIKRWIHWVKTREYISYDAETKIEGIKDVSEEEMKEVYKYLETIMDVWNMSALTEFGSKLDYAVEALGSKESLGDKEVSPVNITAKDNASFWNPQTGMTPETKNKLEKDALNLAIRINEIVK